MSAPASARPTAIARPIPLDPPVTKAVLPCKEKSESTFAVAIVYTIHWLPACSPLDRLLFISVSQFVCSRLLLSLVVCSGFLDMASTFDTRDFAEFPLWAREQPYSYPP